MTSEIALQTLVWMFEHGDERGTLVPYLDLQIANLVRQGHGLREASEMSQADFALWSVSDDQRKCIETWLRQNPRKVVTVRDDTALDYVGDTRPANGTYNVPSLLSDALAYCKGSRGWIRGGSQVGTLLVLAALGGLLVWGLHDGAGARA